MANKFTTGEQKNIKALLIIAGVKQTEIAERVRRSKSLVSEVVAGKKKAPIVRRAIARALGVRPSELWPRNNGEAE